jgi:allophanate hydrolase
VVASLVAAGAIYIGKTNLDQFATGLVGTRSPYGVVKNTFNPDGISGGSSSGSAAVVARGVVPFALGTDTAGSGRVPAAFNNIVGLKPTPGRVSTQGVVPACRTLDCISIFALTAADASRVLAVIEGSSAGSSGPQPVFSPGPAKFPSQSAVFPMNSMPLRVGIPEFLVSHVQADYAVAFRDTCDSMKLAMGASILPFDFQPLHEVASLLYNGPWIAERYAAVGSFIKQFPGAVDPIVRDLILPAENLKATDAFRGRYRLEELSKAIETVWDNFDVLMVPTAPCHPTIAAVANDPVDRNNELGSYTNFVNLLGWCALAVPAALLPDRSNSVLPFGISWIARAGYDLALLNLGAEWQKSTSAALGFGMISANRLAGQVMNLELESPLPLSEAECKVAVVGAHLSGMPLHSQLIERRARFVECTRTAARYRLYCLKDSVPPKPGLSREDSAGVKIEVEIYAFPESQMGSFLALIPHPLGLGSLELENGEWVTGFICEQSGFKDARDISEFGGWRSYMSSTLQAKSSVAIE